jgi:predicted transcriptional regulator of viral defense system
MAFYVAIGYLVKKGRVRRLGSGRYLVPGIGKSAARGGPEEVK